MVSELTTLGAQAEARPDGMLINGVERFGGGKVSSGSSGLRRMMMSPFGSFSGG